MKIQVPALTLNLKPLVLLAPLALLATAPHAQRGGSKVGVVNVESVLQKVPGGKAVADLRKKADTDLGNQTKQIQALQQKVASGSASASDRQALDTAVRTFNAAQQNYSKQIAAQFQPVAGRVNTAVAAAAKAGGFAIVFDAGVAARSGLIIYADNNATNLTSAVLKQIK